MHGPVQDEPPKVYAFLDLTRGSFTSGLNHEPLQIQLPKDFQLAEDPPRVVAFELVPARLRARRTWDEFLHRERLPSAIADCLAALPDLARALRAGASWPPLAGAQKDRWLHRGRHRAGGRAPPKSSPPTNTTSRGAVGRGTDAGADRSPAADAGALCGDAARAARSGCACPTRSARCAAARVRPNGLEVHKVGVPLGVILFIYESRPNVTVDAAGLCVKSGNAVILRGGREALHSNTALHRILQTA